MVEIYLLEQLIAVYNAGTLTKAAEDLNITQSALSRSMKKLEDSLDVRLFERSKNKISLTTYGEQTALFSIDYIKRGDDWIKQLQKAALDKFSFSFGACSPQTVADITQITDEQFPDSEITWEMVDNDELLQGIYDDKFLFAFLHSEHGKRIEHEDNTLFYKFYGSEQLYLNVPEGNSLSDKEDLSFKEIDGITMILFQNTGFWEAICRQKMPKAKFLIVTDINALGDIASTSIYPSFTTDIILSAYGNMPGFYPIPIVDSEASTDYYFVCKKSNLAKIRELNILKV